MPTEEQRADEAVMNFLRANHVSHGKSAGSGILPATQLGSDELVPMARPRKGNRVNLEVRYCANEGCTTKLSRYNLGTLCGVHER